MIGVAVVFLRRHRPPAPGPRRAARVVGAGLGDVRRGLGGALRRHRGDRLRPARRRRRRRRATASTRSSSASCTPTWSSCFVGLTVGLLFALLATGARAEARAAVLVLLGVEVAQGAVGFVQYFTDLPVVLVGSTCSAPR